MRWAVKSCTRFSLTPDTFKRTLQFNTRKTTRQTTLGADLRSQLASKLKLTTTTWIGTRGVTQFQAIPTATQVPPSHPGGVIDFDRRYGGVDLRATYEFDMLTHHLGLDVEGMHEHRRGYQNFDGTTLGVLGSLRRDETNRVTSLDPYWQSEWRAADAVRLFAGARASRIRISTSDHYVTAGNGDDSSVKVFEAISPGAGVVFKPTAEVSVFAAYGRGFETPTLNELAYSGPLRPARSNHWDLGIKAAGATASASVTLFAIRGSDEILPLTNSGGRSSFRNAGRTQRDGVEAAGHWNVGERLRLATGFAWLDRNHVGSVIVNEGNARFFEPAPRQAWLAGIDWHL
jgi:iron complex outermembrane receptor protein